MKLAILFWFYKSPNVCRNRVRQLRRHNPSVPIYGLFGGDPVRSAEFEKALRPWLDDFFVHPAQDGRWKWRHGDLVIADWYAARGRFLEWDSVVVVQWDMLVLASVDTLFAGVGRDEILLSGLRPVREVEAWWPWVREDTPGRATYERFLDDVRERYGYDADPLCCLFIVLVFPRSFLERYMEVEERELGFLEYRVPIYGQIFGSAFADGTRFRPWWAADPTTRHVSERERMLNAAPKNLKLRTIVAELREPTGTRIFHPYRRWFPSALERLIAHRHTPQGRGDEVTAEGTPPNAALPDRTGESKHRS